MIGYLLALAPGLLLCAAALPVLLVAQKMRAHG